GLAEHLQAAATLRRGARVFAHHVPDPSRYGVVSFDRDGRAFDIEEKPEHPQSSYAVVGLYLYDHQVVEIAKSLRPSARGELEITDLNRVYLERGELDVAVLDRGTAWIDAGTADSLLQAGNFVQYVEQQQRVKIGCPEEVAWRLGYLTDDQLHHQARRFGNSAYGSYLLELLESAHVNAAAGPVTAEVAAR